MKAFKTKSITAAVIAGLGAAASMQASAVNISADNTGQVLLYPYYTVRSGFVTSLSVVNTSQSHTKVAKVRFLEGKNSAEVLDFNLFLSPRDVWTASVVDNGTGAAVFSVDRSCTAPALGNTAATAQPFVNTYYTGQTGIVSAPADNGGVTLDRTREGYVEIIEMGVVANGADTDSSPATSIGNSVAAAVKHASTGIPANCGVVRFNSLFGAGDLRQPVGGLQGTGIIINAATGTEFAYNPVALANFYFDAVDATTDLYSDPGNLNPDLRNVSPARSDVFIEDTGSSSSYTVLNWTAVAGGAAVDAVSAILMRSAIQNEYDVSTGFKTDWVITAPTKRYYVFTGTPTSAAVNLASGPFTTNFASATAGGAQSCDPVLPAVYDREEAPYFQQSGIQFSPIAAGPGTTYGSLCWESTVMTVIPAGGTLANASVFGSVNSSSLTLPSTGSSTNYANGWISLFPSRTGAAAANFGPGQQAVFNTNTNNGLNLPNVAITVDAQGGLRNAAVNTIFLNATGVATTTAFRYRGLPVIGFAAINAILGGQGYGGVFPHKFQRTIE